MKDHYKENYEKLGEKYQIPKKWKDTLKKINKTEMSVLSKLMYKFKVILIKLLVTFFTEIGKTIIIFVQNYKRAHIINTILCKNNNVGDISLPGLKI